MGHTDRRRWAVWEDFRILKGGARYLDRLRVFQTPLLSLYIHRIHTPDVDEHPHDHPWWFCSFVLSGEYTEHVYNESLDLSVFQSYRRRRGSLHFIRRKYAHRIIEIEGDLRTLVVTGPHHESWNFWTPDGPVCWEEVVRKAE
jgi:hypothetical protein